MTATDATAGSRTFASLEVPEYRRLWIAGTLAFFAMPTRAVARGYLAYELTGSNAALGVVFLGMGLPMLVLSPLGGVAADRFSKRSLLVATHLTLTASTLGITIALLSDRLSFWMLVASAVLQGAAFSVLAPTRLAFSAELVGRDRLMNAVLLSQVSMNATRVVGPALAGAMIGIAVLGPEGVYVLLTASLLVSVVLLFRLPPGRPRGGRPTTSGFEDLRAGIAYVRGRPDLAGLTVMSLVVIALAFPYVSFLPSLVEDVLGQGPGWLGGLSSAGAVGAVVVSLRIAGRRSETLTPFQVAVAGVAFGVGVALLGLAPSVWWAVGAAVVAGAGAAAFQSLSNSLVLLRADDEYHGRVQSLLMLGFSAFGIFAAPLGALADAVGLRTTLVAMGVCACAAVVLLALAIARAEAPVPSTAVAAG